MLPASTGTAAAETAAAETAKAAKAAATSAKRTGTTTEIAERSRPSVSQSVEQSHGNPEWQTTIAGTHCETRTASAK